MIVTFCWSQPPNLQNGWLILKFLQQACKPPRPGQDIGQQERLRLSGGGLYRACASPPTLLALWKCEGGNGNRCHPNSDSRNGAHTELFGIGRYGDLWHTLFYSPNCYFDKNPAVDIDFGLEYISKCWPAG